MFKIGDRVRFKDDAFSFAGEFGTVVGINHLDEFLPYDVELDEARGTMYPTREKEIERV